MGFKFTVALFFAATSLVGTTALLAADAHAAYPAAPSGAVVVGAGTDDIIWPAQSA